MVQVGTEKKRLGVQARERYLWGCSTREGADDLPEWPSGMLFCCFGVIFSLWEGRVAIFRL